MYEHWASNTGHHASSTEHRTLNAPFKPCQHAGTAKQYCRRQGFSLLMIRFAACGPCRDYGTSELVCVFFYFLLFFVVAWTENFAFPFRKAHTHARTKIFHTFRRGKSLTTVWFEKWRATESPESPSPESSTPVLFSTNLPWQRTRLFCGHMRKMSDFVRRDLPKCRQ